MPDYSDLFMHPRTLENAHVRLEPISPAHKAGLRHAGSEPEIWTYMRINAAGEAFDPWFENALACHDEHHMAIYTARDGVSGEIVGSTGFLCIDPENKVVQLGHTWFSSAARGTSINPASKRLLLEEAFEAEANRVVLRADGRNTRSRAAIERIGATFEGLLRNHMVLADGTLRDTACYAILAEEWPSIRERLDTRIAA